MMRPGSVWSRWRRVFLRDPLSEVDAELEYHIEERVRDYIERGMDPRSARRAAEERLGDIERVRTECTGLLVAERRADQRRTRLVISWLDVKLGIRMLARYPGLSLVAVFGMAVAIAIGAGYFAAFGTMLDPALPLDQGDRVVSIRNRDMARPGSDAIANARDFALWRDELKSVGDIGAFRSETRNLIMSDGSTDLVEVAEMTASGFVLARVSPLLGRALIDEDERESASPVVVIGYDEWRRRFDSDPDIVGQSLRFGETLHTVIGVMPAGFRFPLRHQYWLPAKLNPLEVGRDGGPSIKVFGRLADGFNFRQARAELETISSRLAVAFPETHEHLRAEVIPYTWDFVDIEGPGMAMALRAIQLAISLLLIIVAVNVAILVYARTVTRSGEIAVRSALGASRRRVITQLFVEALALSVVAAAIGLTIAGVALGITNDVLQVDTGSGFFWLEFGLSPGLVVYVMALAIMAGGIIGVLPALKATGIRVQSGLQQLSSRGSSMQLGRTWTALIIVQVAIAVAAMPAAVNFAEQSARIGTRDPHVVANDMLRANLVMEREEAPTAAVADAYDRAFLARYSDRTADLIRRLEAEQEVSGVTAARYFPGLERFSWIEVESTGTQMENATPGAENALRRHGVRTNRVAINLFDVFEVPVLAGRGFVLSDTHDSATAVIVNEAFARRIAGGANVVGRRLRYPGSESSTAPGQWYEVVGVVADFAAGFTTPSSFDPVMSRLYHARSTTQGDPATLVVRVRGGSPAGFAAPLRDLAAAVDPALTLDRLETVAGAWSRGQKAFWYAALGIIAVTLSVLLLSAAGIYAMMSFTVARRRREIGIRAALGADPRRVLTGIFRRASAQLGAGVLAGLLIAVALDRWPGDIMGGRAGILLPAVSALMLAVGLLAALGPARRGLAVQPTEALREE